MAALSDEELETLGGDLASFARSGIPMTEGLRRMARELRSPRLRRLYAEAANSLTRGAPLSAALGQSGRGAPGEFVAAVQCAEASGDMVSVLEFAVEHSRRVRLHRSSLLTSVSYPAFVVSMVIVIFLLLSYAVMPSFQRAFARLGANDFPPQTKAVFAAGEFVRSPVGLGLAAGILALIALWMTSERFRDQTPFVFRFLEFFAPVMTAGDASIVTRFLSVMLGKGVTLPTALRAASLCVFKARTRRALLSMAQAVEKGHRAGPLLDGVFSPAAAYLFQQGEERGDLAASCAGIADYSEARFRRYSDNIVSLLEPVLIVVLGSFIGLVVISLYLPLFEMGSHIH